MATQARPPLRRAVVKPRKLTDQHVEKNEDADLATTVTTFSVSKGPAPAPRDTPRQSPIPTLIAEHDVSDNIQTLAIVEIPKKKVIRSRTSYSIKFRYPQRYHYTQGRFHKYKYSLYTIPQCLKQAPSYNLFPLRQSCKYDPHDSVTVVKKHKVTSGSLPHPKDNKHIKMGLTHEEEEEEEKEEETGDYDNYSDQDDGDDENRNGTFSYSHDDNDDDGGDNIQTLDDLVANDADDYGDDYADDFVNDDKYDSDKGDDDKDGSQIDDVYDSDHSIQEESKSPKTRRYSSGSEIVTDEEKDKGIKKPSPVSRRDSEGREEG